jgi:hypothetical protein
MPVELADIPVGFKEKYNVVTGVFEDNVTGNKISILRDKFGGLVVGIAGSELKIRSPLFFKHLSENLAQEVMGVGSATPGYVQAGKLFEGVLKIIDCGPGILSNI